MTSGGVSTGEEDHVRAAVEALGRLDFWRLAIKPGRPVALGPDQSGVPFIGLPGNPVAVAVTFVHAGAAADPAPGRRAAIAPRLTFPVRGRLRLSQEGGPRANICAPGSSARRRRAVVARKYPRDGAGILSSMVESDGFVILDESLNEPHPRHDGRFPAVQPRCSGVRLLYFAWLRAAIGTPRRSWPCRPGCMTSPALLDGCKARGGNYAEALSNLSVVRVAVNQEYVGRDHPIRDGDEVALFPPVTGG